MALAFFYTVGTGIGGVTGPALFGKLVETEKEINVFSGYLIGAVLMIAAGIAEWFIGVEAAGKSLEDVARPLTAEGGRGRRSPGLGRAAEAGKGGRDQVLETLQPGLGGWAGEASSGTTSTAQATSHHGW